MNEQKAHNVNTDVSTPVCEHMKDNTDEAQARLTTPRVQAMIVSKQASNQIYIYIYVPLKKYNSDDMFTYTFISIYMRIHMHDLNQICQGKHWNSSKKSIRRASGAQLQRAPPPLLDSDSRTADDLPR